MIRKFRNFGSGWFPALPRIMSIMCWNCHGLGKRQTVQDLRDIIQAQDITVEFLAKTWLLEARLAGISDSLQFSHCYGVSKVNHGGGC